ncbi:hypothetical protein Taro_026679, partial [Colocasia esculenta]|nr:hypothetical protein [Colocasia esculenta]
MCFHQISWQLQPLDFPTKVPRYSTVSMPTIHRNYTNSPSSVEGILIKALPHTIQEGKREKFALVPPGSKGGRETRSMFRPNDKCGVGYPICPSCRHMSCACAGTQWVDVYKQAGDDARPSIYRAVLVDRPISFLGATNLQMCIYSAKLHGVRVQIGAGTPIPIASNCDDFRSGVDAILQYHFKLDPLQLQQEPSRRHGNW